MKLGVVVFYGTVILYFVLVLTIELSDYGWKKPAI